MSLFAYDMTEIMEYDTSVLVTVDAGILLEEILCAHAS